MHITLAAVLVALIVPWGIGQFWQALRSLGFKRWDKKSFATKADEFGSALLSVELSADAELARQRGSDLRADLQKQAQRAQDEYQKSVARGVGAIVTAFIVLAASVVWGSNNSDLVLFSAVLDLACFSFSVVAFWSAAHWNRIWLMRRAKNELLRQWCVIDNLLSPDAQTESEVDSEYATFRARVEDALGKEERAILRTIWSIVTAPFASKSRKQHGRADLSSKVLDFWRMRRGELFALTAARNVSVGRLAMHFKKRPKAQGQWFPRAHARLSEHGSWRGWLLFWIFMVTTVLAAVKTALLFDLFPHDWASIKPILTFSMLVMIGISAAISALYLNQNNRSLTHRYSAQIRQIDAWLELYRPVLGAAERLLQEANREAVKRLSEPEGSDQNPSAREGAALALVPTEMWSATLPLILQFEDLMIEELLDFISISEHDVLEISPA